MKLDRIHQQFLKKLVDSFDDEKELEDFSKTEAFANLLSEESDGFAHSFYEDILSSNDGLQYEIDTREEFETNNQLRWQEGFGLIEKLVAVCADLGGAASQYFQQELEDIGEAKASAMITLHARCVRVAGEVFALMRCGFADGAYARWRTMHELHATCLFIANSSDDTAQRYHEAWILKCYARAKAYKDFEDSANLQKFDASEFGILELHKDRISAKYSDDISKDWAWARSELKLPTKSNVTFLHIEKHVSLDHLRPYVQLAHQEIHAGFVRPDKGLGVSEGKQVVQLVGPSNSGMVDPGQNLALTIASITATLLNVNPTLDSIAYSKALDQLAQQVFVKLKIGDQRTANQ